MRRARPVGRGRNPRPATRPWPSPSRQRPAPSRPPLPYRNGPGMPVETPSRTPPSLSTHSEPCELWCQTLARLDGIRNGAVRENETLLGRMTMSIEQADSFLSAQTRSRGGSRVRELDGLIAKDAAQCQSNHERGLPRPAFVSSRFPCLGCLVESDTIINTDRCPRPGRLVKVACQRTPTRVG